MLDVTDVIPWSDICFIDCETRSTMPGDTPDTNVMNTSTRRYAAQAFPIIITWAYDLDGPVKRWEWTRFDQPPTREDLPEELLMWAETGYFAAWHAAFDRAVLDRYFNAGVDAWLDMMVQASFNNIPLGLDRAAKSCGYEGKLGMGKALIRLFCPVDGATPDEEPEKWAQFCEYADIDVSQMQLVAAATFAVPFAIWREYWTSERINDRGLPVDLDMARGGAAVAAAYAEQTNDRVREITDGALYSVRQYDAQRAWVWERVRNNPLIAQHMIIAQRTLKTGEEEYKLKMDRPIIVKMLAALNTLNESDGLTDDEYNVQRFLEEREYGASAAPAKFQKVLDMVMPDGRLPNSYVFSGATQTGRFSSKGVQVHNMTRDTVGDTDKEEDACIFLIEAGENHA
jgi:hypothetical protein